MADKLSVKDKMQAAKRYIEAKDYGRARAILKTVNHPTAREWEKKLDKAQPAPTPSKWGWKQYRWVLLIVLLIVFGVMFAIQYQQNQEAGDFFAEQLDARRTEIWLTNTAP